MFNLSSEKALISMCINNPDKAHEILPLINLKYFGTVKENYFSYLHSKIFEIFNNIYDNGVTIDEVLLNSYISKNGFSDNITKEYVHEITMLNVSADSYLEHVSHILEAYNKRQLSNMIDSLSKKMVEPNTSFTELNKIVSGYTHLAEESGSNKAIDTNEIIAIMNKESIQRITSNEKIIRYNLGFKNLDEHLLLKDGSLILIAARPSTGKTSFALKVANHFKATQGNTAFFSFEMAKEDLLTSLMSMELKHSIEFIETMSDAQQIKLRNTYETLNKSKFKLFLDGEPYSIESLIMEMTRLYKTEHVTNFFIDYIQLMVNDKTKMNSELSAISRMLKLFTLKYGVRVFALSQLNRSLEYRDDKRPILADLRDSGSLEQDADVVIFLYRPMLYGITKLKVYDNQVPTKRLSFAIIGKSRRGKIGQVPLTFIPENVLFMDYDIDLITNI